MKRATAVLVVVLALATAGWAKDKGQFCTTSTVALDKDDLELIYPADVESLTWLRVVPEGTPGAGGLHVMVEHGQPHSSSHADSIGGHAESGQWIKVTLIFSDAAGHVLWRKTGSGFEGVVANSRGNSAEAHESSIAPQDFITGFLSDLGRKGRACASHEKN
jgi:hypothetical protein